MLGGLQQRPKNVCSAGNAMNARDGEGREGGREEPFPARLSSAAAPERVRIIKIRNYDSRFHNKESFRFTQCTGLGKRVAPRLCKLALRSQRVSGGRIHAT